MQHSTLNQYCIDLFKSSPISFFSYFGADIDKNTFWYAATCQEVQDARLKQEYPLFGLFLEEGYYWYNSFASPHIINFYRSFELDNFFTIIRKNHSVIQTFNFATSLEHPDLINYYFNNLDFLNDFIDQFLQDRKSYLDELRNKEKKIFDNLQVTPVIQEDKNTKATIPYIKDKFYNQNTKQWIVLSARERQVLFLSALKGQTSREIGKQLDLSPKTIDNYIENLRIKLDAESVRTLLVRAVDLGLIRLQTYF